MAEYDFFSESFARTRKKHWPDIDELIWLLPKDTYLGHIADIGCWSGRFIDYIPNFSPERYVWLDISQGMIDTAKKSYPGIDFRVLNMTDIWQVWQKVDTIFFIASLQHICTIEEQKIVLDAAYRQLTDGWYIWLLNWNLISTEAINKYPPNLEDVNIRKIPFQGNLRTYFAIAPETLDTCLLSVGFKEVKSILSSTGRNFLTIARK